MVALQIRDVPDDVRDALVEQAKARGQSLQAYLLDLVGQQARRSLNIVLLDRFSGRTDGSSDGGYLGIVREMRDARAQGDVVP